MKNEQALNPLAAALVAAGVNQTVKEAPHNDGTPPKEKQPLTDAQKAQAALGGIALSNLFLQFEAGLKTVWDGAVALVKQYSDSATWNALLADAKQRLKAEGYAEGWSKTSFGQYISSLTTGVRNNIYPRKGESVAKFRARLPASNRKPREVKATVTPPVINTAPVVTAPTIDVEVNGETITVLESEHDEIAAKLEAEEITEEEAADALINNALAVLEQAAAAKDAVTATVSTRIISEGAGMDARGLALQSIARDLKSLSDAGVQQAADYIAELYARERNANDLGAGEEADDEVLLQQADDELVAQSDDDAPELEATDLDDVVDDIRVLEAAAG